MGRKRRKRRRDLVVLSARELTVLRLYSLGNDPVEIARHLAIGKTSVKTFLARAGKKLKAKHRCHTVALALRQRLIT